MNSSAPYSPHCDWSVVPLAAAATELLGLAEEEGRLLSEEKWEETLAWAHTSLSTRWAWSGPGLGQVDLLWPRPSTVAKLNENEFNPKKNNNNKTILMFSFTDIY